MISKEANILDIIQVYSNLPKFSQKTNKTIHVLELRPKKKTHYKEDNFRNPLQKIQTPT